jgi:hypothetical protein
MRMLQVFLSRVWFLNAFAGIAGFVWLAILGQWELVIVGILALVLSTFLLWFALMPAGLLFGTPGMALLERRHFFIGALPLLLEEAWTYAVMFVWCLFVFHFTMGTWGGPNYPVYPSLLWMYGVATGPFTYAVVRDANIPLGAVPALAACVGMIIVMGLVLLKLATSEAIIAGLLGPMMIAWIVQGIYLATLRARLGGRPKTGDRALDLPSNWALRNVLVVLTGALIFFGCALAAVLAAPLPAAKQQQPEASDAGMEVPPLAGFSRSPEALNATLHATPLWRILKRDFPDWYAERLKEIAALAAQNKDDAEIAQQMMRALVALRRQNFSYALAANLPKLKAVARTFYENLVEMQKQSDDACFKFISQGEASPTIVDLLRGSPDVARLEAFLTAVFEAIADGRTARRVHPQPRKSDYHALAIDLTQRGWTQADMRLFSDERALAHAGAAKVCQMVRDWFAAELAIKDAEMQLRLLVDSLKPIVAG